MYKPDKSVVEAIENYNERITVQHNPWSTSEDNALMVCYKYQQNMLYKPIDEKNGVFRAMSSGVPVLVFPQYMQFSNWLIKELEISRASMQRHFTDVIREKMEKHGKDLRSYHNDFNREVGYWHYKNLGLGNYSMGNISGDPTRNDKEFQDKYGVRRGKY